MTFILTDYLLAFALAGVLFILYMMVIVAGGWCWNKIKSNSDQK